MTYRKPTCTHRPAGPPRRRLSGNETILIIVITVIAAVLAHEGLAVLTVLELVTGCGLVAMHLARRAPLAPPQL